MKYLKLLFFIMATITISCSASFASNDTDKLSQLKASGYDCDSFTTPKGRKVDIYFIKHASLVLDIDGYLVYIDPTTIYGNDFSKMPKADLLLVTHSHHDHLDPTADNVIISEGTKMIGGGDVPQHDSRFEGVVPGDVINDTCVNFTITCTPAYNTTPDHLQFHPKERKDVGYLFDIDGLRIYVAGDTEVIPEMESLRMVDVAFLPVNQPYTMTPEQAIEATKIIHPRILYPYHYGDTDLTPLLEYFKPWDSIEVRDRNMQ